MNKPFLNPSLDRAGLDKKMEMILEILKKRNWTIGVMESCTGGAIANCITNIPGASDIFKEGKVTYSDEAKVEAGVDKKIIEKFGVYSKETAEEMVRKIEGDVGVGVTGNMNDPAEVFVAVRIGSAKQNKIVSEKIVVKSKNKDEVEARKEKKRMVVKKVVEMIIDNL
jgi:PncC family amidohydrolase